VEDEARVRLPMSVVVPTVGRTELVRACVASLVACEPGAEEILVVDQSGDPALADAVHAAGDGRARVVPCDGRGVARATNLGVREARNEAILVTHDDCTVATDWVAAGFRHLKEHPDVLFTGRVKPPPGAAYVPSTKDDPVPHDFTGERMIGVLYPASMAFSRSVMLEFGGFDERDEMRLAEDNDLCYRWLDDGRGLRYEPDMVVWHHDWRTPEQIVQTHLAYARSEGALYAKYLYARDWRILPFLWWELRTAVRARAGAVVHGRPRWQDERREMLFPLLGALGRGLATEWRRARPPGQSRGDTPRTRAK
jgi:GT2 family glycosyltransferase